MAHLVLAACPNSLRGPSAHTQEQFPYFLLLTCLWFENYVQDTIKSLDKWGLMLVGVHQPMVAPTIHLELESCPNTLQESSI